MSDNSIKRSVNGTVSTVPLALAICTIAAGMFFAIAWSATTRVPELVRAPGQIGPLNDLARIDHFDGGVVHALYVDPGDKVSAGQLLAVITEPDLEAEIHTTEQRVATLERDRYRLHTVLARLDNQVSSPEAKLEHDSDSALSAYIGSQEALFRARRSTMTARIDRLLLSVDASVAIAENALLRLSIAEENRSKAEDLFDQRLMSQADYSVRLEAAQHIQETVLEADMQVLQARDRLQEAQGNLLEAESTWREDLVARLYDVDGELSALELELREMHMRAKRAELRAPRDGIIQNIQADAVGQVVAPGGPVMDMLAADDALVAVVKLSPKDIGHVFVGAPVSIRPTTFDFRRYGDIDGDVVSIAPTSQMSENNQPYFRTVIALKSTNIGSGDSVRALRAGMEVSADITTSDRTVLSYFFKPAERVMSVSLTER